MHIIPAFTITNDEITAYTAIGAFVLSIISIIISIVFQMKQEKHNKNTLKPISSIKFNDYENQIMVKIENVGTGPLIIKTLVFKREPNEYKDALISFMPNIPQPWSTFTNTVNGWTIPAGGNLILLKLNPKDDEIRNLVRKSLSNIVLQLDYTDVYHTKFKDERSLAFFGRQFNQKKN